MDFKMYYKTPKPSFLKTYSLLNSDRSSLSYNRKGLVSNSSISNFYFSNKIKLKKKKLIYSETKTKVKNIENNLIFPIISPEIKKEENCYLATDKKKSFSQIFYNIMTEPNNKCLFKSYDKQIECMGGERNRNIFLKGIKKFYLNKKVQLGLFKRVQHRKTLSCSIEEMA